MPKPKFVKPLLIGVACTIPIGLVVGLSVNWDNTQFISAVGSSGVKPFIEKFGKQYHNDFSNFDVTVESGGTTFAVSQLAQGFTNLGNASNNPYLNIQEEGILGQWATKKTLTLGWEGLALVYKLPDGLTQNAKEKFEIVITKDNILPLYAVFSCIHDLQSPLSWEDRMLNLWYYAPADVQAQITDINDRDLLQHTPILPYLRSGGNTGANSSIAFTCYSNLVDFYAMTEEQQKAFRGGRYGNDNPHYETDESNSRAWQSFTNNNIPGSMVYLTTSFLAPKSNRQSMIDHNCKVAQYLDLKASTPTAIQIDTQEHWEQSVKSICEAGKYNWYRPINTMLDINLQKAKDFVYWIYFGNSQASQPQLSEFYINTVLGLGTKPLSIPQLETMMAGTGPYKDRLFDTKATDIELAKTRTIPYNQVYGAQDETN